MSELENPFGFEDLDEGLDIEAIFGGGSSPEQESPKAADAELTAQSEERKDDPPDLFSALTATDTTETKKPAQTSLFDKPAVFSYGGVKEAVEDAAVTFEDLRLAKSDDFPELAERKNVSWTVEYGKSSKYISAPEKTTVESVKREIERSKAFLDTLTKAKKPVEREPECLLKPKVTAQKKGIASYKGIFPTAEAARASDKTICLIPSRNGCVYEMRKTELGEFIVPKNNILEFSELRAGFTPALPLIPRETVGQIISFFRSFMDGHEEYEALAHVYWDKKQENYTVFVPQQRVSRSSIDADLSADMPAEERYIHYADFHSHNSMKARFSATDDRDEKAARLYFVIGRLNSFYPEITARISCGGTFLEIEPALVLESLGEDFPRQWRDRVHKTETCGLPPYCRVEEGKLA